MELKIISNQRKVKGNYICKIMTVAGLNPKNKKVNWDFMSVMGELMSKGNNDGLGYTAVNPKGNIFGESWLFNYEAFEKRDTHTKPKKVDKGKIAKIKALISGDFVELEDEVETPGYQKYGSWGDLGPEIVAVTLHTRAATNTVCFENVHPFVDQEKSVSVIHNGVIRNHVKEDEIRSTCDSERILNKYLEHNVGEDPTKLQKFINDIKGWYACGIFAKDANGLRVLDIFRTNANLGCVYVKELDALVYTTDIDDVKRACRILDMTILSKKNAVKEDMFVRIDPFTGKHLLTAKYTSNVYTWANQGHQNHGHVGFHDRSYMDGMSGSYDGGYNEKLLAWEKEAEAKRKAVAETNRNNVLTLPVKTEERKTESQQQEEAELRKSGMSEEDIQMNAARKEIETAKEIIQKNTDDKLNEQSAALDGYHMNRENGLWIKRTSKLN